MSSLQELLVEEIRDLLDAEKQLAKSLPKHAKVATTPQLKEAFMQHAEMTQNQVARLEKVFEVLGERAKSKPCKAMKGLIEEAQEHVQEHGKGQELDAMLVAAAQRVEHYEIAGYGTARAYAKSMGNREAANLLNETLKEEEMTDKLLSKIGLEIQKEMLRQEGEDEGEADNQMRRYEGEGRRASGGRAPGARGGSANGGRGGAAKKKVAARSGNSNSRSGNGGRKSGGASSNVTTDHHEIREWAEARGAHPACVRGTGGKRDTGMIRLDFPGYSGAESLQEITWDEFFEKFDEQRLALLYQDETARGQTSNFNKLIARETAELREKGGRDSARRGSSKGR